MIGHVLTALLAVAPLAGSASSFIDAHDLGGNGVADVPHAAAHASRRSIRPRRAQELAHQTRLGAPITISTEPRHSFTENIGTGFKAGSFSGWPEVLGLAATWDSALVCKFAEAVRQEYRAARFRCAPQPTLDLATEPQWVRLSDTWEEDANVAAKIIVPYIEDFHGDGFGPHSLATLPKQFPGGDPVENGEGSHFSYGKTATYPGNNFGYHLVPFEAAIAAGARAMMYYFSRPIGTKYEEVGFGFNKGTVTDLLRKFGGKHVTDMLVDLIWNGPVTEEHIDTSVGRLLREKFLLRLFDNPFVDPGAAERSGGNEYFVQLRREAQRRSRTLLTNNNAVPLRRAPWGSEFYIEGFNKTCMEARNVTVVDKPEEADFALLKVEAPSLPRSGAFEKSFASGSFEFDKEEKGAAGQDLRRRLRDLRQLRRRFPRRGLRPGQARM
ncbi:hypothetical protein DL767_007507 [Monosporascus sp. MG133]|nr:hypothetical protein DL767_007507 [Monosporascus sp. MG133]